MSVTQLVIASFLAGMAVAVVTTPVGVSGAVFLLPIQLTGLGVPSPAVTPTNLLFNIVAIPGALARYRDRLRRPDSLTAWIMLGTLPGIVVGAVIRVLLVPGSQTFKVIVAAFLLPLGIWLCVRTIRRPEPQPERKVSRGFIISTALVVGVLGGIYGVGGGSLLSPILVGRGMPLSRVAPATLLSTFVTSVAGALTYVVLAATTGAENIAPVWTIGIAAGVGGLIGGYIGAWLQPHAPERALRLGLGVLAIAAAGGYAAQGLF